MSASVVLSVNPPAASPPHKGPAPAKASGFDDLVNSTPHAEPEDRPAPAGRPAHRPKAEAAPQAEAVATGGGEDSATPSAPLPPPDARSAPAAVDVLEAAPTEAPVVAIEPVEAAADAAPKGPVDAAVLHVVLPEPAPRDAPVAAGLTKTIAAEALPAPAAPEDAPAETGAPVVETESRGRSNAESPPPAAAPALAGPLADRATRRNDASSNAAASTETPTPSTDGARADAARPEGAADPAARPAVADPAAKPATDAPVALAAPVDSPVDQAATPAADAAPAAAAVAEVRETSLSGLARATIDATAQISAQILRKLEGRSTRFEMSLHPEDLGRVDVKLDIDSGGRLSARLAFDNPAAATDLRGRADELRRQLEDAGFQMADDAFEFADRDSGSSAFDRGQDARRGQSRAFAAASRLNDEIDVAQPPRWLTLKLSPSGVDMKV